MKHDVIHTDSVTFHDITHIEAIGRAGSASMATWPKSFQGTERGKVLEYKDNAKMLRELMLWSALEECIRETIWGKEDRGTHTISWEKQSLSRD